MINKMCFSVLFFIVLNNTFAQDLIVSEETITGTMVFKYKYLNQFDSYWYQGTYLQSSKYDSIRVTLSYLDGLEHILNTCGDRDGRIKRAIEDNQKNQAIVNSKYYRDPTVRKMGEHVGGEIYQSVNEDSLIFILIRVKCKVLKVHSTCPCFQNPILMQAKTSCEYTDRVTAPFLTVLKAKKISKVSEKTIRELGLYKSKRDSFPVRYCE